MDKFPEVNESVDDKRLFQAKAYNITKKKSGNKWVKQYECIFSEKFNIIWNEFDNRNLNVL